MKRNELYEKVTLQIQEKLKSGIIPWHKPWKSGVPANFITKRPYKGINFLSLCLQDFPNPYYLTYLQCQQLNGEVLNGAKGQMIIFWDIKDYIDENATDTDVCTKKIPLIRSSYLFNLSQTTLYSADTVAPTLISCEEIIAGMKVPPIIKNNIRGCFYNPKEDYISIPTIDYFETPEEYYASLLHELIHSTGHPKRMNRFSSCFRDDKYSSEELVAEIGASYLCALTGITPKVIDNQVSYINSWLGQLNNDPMYFINATVQAQKSVDFIMLG
jgi:antirestriction protein ArdC